MSPCDPNDVSFNIPDGPSGPSIPGFGTGFSLKLPNMNPFPDGFPEDLLDLLEKLQLLIPPGALQSPLNPNFGKDVFDSIMKLLDQFMPFLMLYKFFLPILQLIICIIEVLCAIANPFKLIRALNRLFRTCIPAFLNLFPIFALIIMIISLLLLILALIEYIILKILEFIERIIRNIIALQTAFEDADVNSILAIAKKLGAILCIFQNLFVLFAIFNIIIQIIKDILSLIFAIPPCDDGDPGDEDGCCTPDVCPAIVKTEYTRNTGTFQYLSKVGVQTSITLPAIFGGSFNFDVRPESWQLYDVNQEIAQQFRNIFDAYDVVILPKATFFPTDGVYDAKTTPKQAPYLVDLRLYYNPTNWGRSGLPRFVRFKDCIVTGVPTTHFVQGDATTKEINNAVVSLAAGSGYEDDGSTRLYGYNTDGTTPLDPVEINSFATLENFIHQPAAYSTNPTLSIHDGYTFSNMTYTFKPNIAPLLTKNLVTLGCVPDIALNRAFINGTVFGEIGFKTDQLKAIVNGPNFPNTADTQQCLATAVATLRSNLTIEGVADFQATCNICLNDLKKKTNDALGDMVGVGTDQCKSVLSANPTTQFTSKPIAVKVILNEKNGLPITTGLSETVAKNIAARISPHINFGTIDNFVYDGYQAFTANLTSPIPGSGTLLVSFDNITLCTNILPSNVSLPPSHILQEIPYQFVYTPVGSNVPTVPVGTGDTGGPQPRRDTGDASRDNSPNDGGKDGV